MLFGLAIAAFIVPSLTLGQPPETPSAGSSPAAGDSATQQQTVSGRIVHIDLKSGAIAVRAGDSGKVLRLEVTKDQAASVRRGERVVVTYSGKTATRIEASRSGP